MFPKLNETKIENASTPKSDYLGAGAHTVEIRKFKTSDEVPGYQGTPYTEFMVGNDEGIAFLKFSGVDSHTSEAAAKVRTEIFKSFLISAGATTFQDPHMACNTVINNKIEVCLAKREYWTTDKDTNIPQIKSRVEYKFANPAGKKITFKDSYNKPMSAEDRARYEEALSLSQGGNADIQTPF
tara:strand:- start:1565 stop:2113 length:549 start_codon:yes stop_codon:yes gene_type:complete